MKKIIKGFIPKSIKRYLYNSYRLIIREDIKKENRIAFEQIPKYKLQTKHVKNLKIITDRQELLKYLPQKGIVAELGVDQGDYSKMIYKINQPKKLHLIDNWGSDRYNKEKQENVKEKFSEQIAKGIIEINLGLSTEIVEHFDNEYFDWIYIDTDHSYEVTKQELELWSPKIKKGGVIAGHDFILGNWNSIIRYGVIEAVHEFCVKYNWELVYLTAEFNLSPSFAIRKL